MKTELREKSSGYLIADNTNSSLYALFALLAKDVQAYRLTGAGSDPGTIYIPQQEGIDAKLETIAEKFPINIRPAAAAPTSQKPIFGVRHRSGCDNLDRFSTTSHDEDATENAK